MVRLALDLKGGACWAQGYTQATAGLVETSGPILWPLETALSVPGRFFP